MMVSGSGEQYWGEEGEAIEPRAKPIIARRPRPEIDMEHVLTGADAQDSFPSDRQI
jgi:hypothetical protein